MPDFVSSETPRIALRLSIKARRLHLEHTQRLAKRFYFEGVYYSLSQ